jgi:hypothetical protein
MHLSTMIILIQKKHQHFKQNHNDMFFFKAYICYNFLNTFIKHHNFNTKIVSTF